MSVGPRRIAAALVPVIVVGGLIALALFERGRRPALPPDLRLGERLFRETRFAQSFAGGGTGSAPVSCATCHLSDESVAKGGPRAFCDFAERSPVPPRDDGHATTLRNAPALVDTALPRAGTAFFHYDGQFGSLEELAAATLTGRNFGWLPKERAEAVAHVARVVREDTSGLAGQLSDPALPAPLRLDVARASDEEVLAAVSRLLAHYVRRLAYGADGTNARDFRSPYDVFLAKNGLPARPDAGESPLDYGRRLRGFLLKLEHPVDVGPGDGSLTTHAHPFQFGPSERRGLVVFLTEPDPAHPGPRGGVSPGGIGSCVACHAPPAFTDFGFHNVGISQVEYDAAHGLGTFAKLAVPGLAERNAAAARFLPPSPAHPDAQGPFLAVPRRDAPGRADLGLWNVFANPDCPDRQTELRGAIAARLGVPPTTPDAELLEKTIGWMKTPALRNLGHSAPYFHGGHVDTLEGAVQHYRSVGFSARGGQIRNGAPELSGIDLALQDLVDVAAFLRALDEDPP